MKRPLLVIITVSALLFTAMADQAAKPKLQLMPDGFPGGHDTPEGAACDLARAFIKRDPALFRDTCIRLYGPAAYARFQEGVVASMKEEAAKSTPSPGGPKTIGKVFAARHLTKDGPASYGYALFEFQDVMFVDVGVILQNGAGALNRTMVIKDKDGKWYVHPVPDVSPLLCAGLNQEPASNQDFSEFYDVVK